MSDMTKEEIMEKAKLAVIEEQKRFQYSLQVKSRLAMLTKQVEEKRRLKSQMEFRNDQLRRYLEKKATSNEFLKIIDENDSCLKTVTTLLDAGIKSRDLGNKMNVQRAEMTKTMTLQLVVLKERVENVVKNEQEMMSSLKTKIAEMKAKEEETEFLRNEKRTALSKQISEFKEQVAAKKIKLAEVASKNENIEKMLESNESEICDTLNKCVATLKKIDVDGNFDCEVLLKPNLSNDEKLAIFNNLDITSIVEKLEEEKRENFNEFQSMHNDFVTDTENAIASKEVIFEKLAFKISEIKEQVNNLEISDEDYAEVESEYRALMDEPLVVEEEVRVIEESPEPGFISPKPVTMRLSSSQDSLLTVRSPDWDRPSLPAPISRAQLETPDSVCKIDNSAPPKVKATNQIPAFATPARSSVVPTPSSPNSSIASSTMDFDVYVNRYCKTNPAVRSKFSFISPPEKSKISVPAKSIDLTSDDDVSVAGASGKFGNKPDAAVEPKKFFQTPRTNASNTLPLKPWFPSAKKSGGATNKFKY